MLILAFAVVCLGLFFGAYRLGIFGSFAGKAVPAEQTGATGEQGAIIPGMPPCGPCESPTPTEAIATVAPTAPTVTAATSLSPVFGLAWFHKPPQDGSSAADIAANDRYIHLTGPSDIPFRNELRAAGYKGPILTYVTMTAVEGPGPYRDASAACDANYQGYDNQLAFNKGDFCKYVHPNESWFLHNGKGERIVEDYFGSGNITYMMNPGDPGWRAFSWSRLKYIKENWGYNGLWLDNLDLDRTRSLTAEKNSDGTLKEYASDAAWREAVAGWLAGFRPQIGSGYPVWANLVGGGFDATSWDPYAPYLDGAMDESFSVSWLDGWRTPEQWQGQIERAQRWLGMGKALLAVGQGPQDNTARLDFTLASYMLVANDKAFFRYTRFDSYYQSLWLYPDFDTARSLGAPLAASHQTSTGVWRRDFAHGYVEVNVSEHTGRLVVNK